MSEPLLLLDTHSWMWNVADRSRLSTRARTEIDSAGELGVSAISPWEIAIKVGKGRLDLGADVRTWVATALAMPRTVLLPLLPEISLRSVELRGIVGTDPADAIIVATALTYGCALVTRDARIRSSGIVRCIW